MNMSWFEKLLNVFFRDPPPPPGQGLDVNYVHSWPWPPWLTLLFFIAAGIYIVAIYLNESGRVPRPVRLGMAALRLTIIGLLVTMMYGWMRDRYRTDLPDVILAIDDSESMDVVDQYRDRSLQDQLERRVRNIDLARTTRLASAQALLLENDARWLRTLNERYNVKFYQVATSARPQSLNGEDGRQVIRSIVANQSSSRLGTGLRDILESQRGRPTAAVIFFTDGVTTDGRTLGEMAQYARRKSVPLFLLGLGDENPPRDVRLSDLLVDDVVFAGDLVNFDFKISGTGFAEEEVRVRLKQKGRPDVLAERNTQLSGNGTQQAVRLSYRPDEEGEFEFEVELEPLDAEGNTTNNRLTRIVRVRDETIRVLFVQEYPNYEFRFLKGLLQRSVRGETGEKAIQLTTVLQDADLDYAALDETAQRVFPVSRDELYEYDVVIFGDVNPSYLSRPVMENLSDFVTERGGGVVFIAGPRFTPLSYRGTPLEDLFPFELDTASLPGPSALLDESFVVQPTPLGMISPQMQLAQTAAASLEVWRQLPAIRWLLRAPDIRLGVRVLAEQPAAATSAGQRLPVICLQFVGAGKVIFHATDESYLWARLNGSDEFYERYWLQSIRYLSRSKLLGASRTAEMPADQNAYLLGEQVPLRVRFLDERAAPENDDGVVVVLERDGGRRQRVKLRRDIARRGIFEGTVSHLELGTYRAWLAAPLLDGNAPSRRFSVVPRPGERARVEMDAADLQRAAKGSQGKFYTIETVQQLMSDLPRGRQVRIEALPARPIWNSPWLAGLFVGLLITEWLLRKKLGWM
jgi:hypothetical protein